MSNRSCQQLGNTDDADVYAKKTRHNNPKGGECGYGFFLATSDSHEDPQTLQTAMELEVRQALSGSRHAGRVPPHVFLTSMAPLITRDSEVFMKAATAVCQIDSTGGRTVLVLSKEKEKEKDKSKAPDVEIGGSSTECVRIPENKSQDGATKCGRAQTKIPANLTQVVDHLLEILMKYPSLNPEENCTRSDNAMEINNSVANKGKRKVDDTKKELDRVSEKSAGLAKDMGDDVNDDVDIARGCNALMSWPLADTDVEDHDETGLGDEYNDDMVDEEEDDEYHENRVIEVRWREALDGVLGQPGAADTGLIDIAAEPFEGVNVDDLFGLRRPLAFDRRLRQSRTSFERSSTEGNNSLQHPLLLRPAQSNESGVIYSSGGVKISRDLESLSGGSFDVAHFYMFDAPVLPFDHSFGDRVGCAAAAPPLSDFSVGLESLQAPPRRGPGDGRWTDDGQPQAGGQVAAIAQAVEEHFMSQLHSVAPSSTSSDPNTINQELNQRVENAEHSGGQSHGPTPDVGNNALDSMEIGEGNESVNEQQELPATDDLASNHQVNTDNTIITEDADVDMNVVDSEANQGGDTLPSVGVVVGPLSEQNTSIAQDAEEIDPEFLAALPPDIQAEVLAQQRAQRVAHQAEGQPVDMDNASIIATFPAIAEPKQDDKSVADNQKSQHE
ncbi:E3 ubiquitin protein ligase UPL1-like protein [Tanacetum coccineum]